MFQHLYWISKKNKQLGGGGGDTPNTLSRDTLDWVISWYKKGMNLKI